MKIGNNDSFVGPRFSDTLHGEDLSKWEEIVLYGSKANISEEDRKRLFLKRSKWDPQAEAIKEHRKSIQRIEDDAVAEQQAALAAKKARDSAQIEKAVKEKMFQWSAERAAAHAGLTPEEAKVAGIKAVEAFRSGSKVAQIPEEIISSVENAAKIRTAQIRQQEELLAVARNAARDASSASTFASRVAREDALIRGGVAGLAILGAGAYGAKKLYDKYHPSAKKQESGFMIESYFDALRGTSA